MNRIIRIITISIDTQLMKTLEGDVLLYLLFLFNPVHFDKIIKLI